MKIILSALVLFSAMAFACDIPEKGIEKHFRQQWDEEGQVTKLPIKIGKQNIVVLSHIDSCGQRGCDHSFYYVNKKCAEEGLSVAGKIVWSEDFSEFTVRRRPLPTEANRPDRKFKYDPVKMQYIEL